MSKKLILSAFIAITALAFTSCKKAELAPAPTYQQATGTHAVDQGPVKYKYRAPVKMKDDVYVCYNLNNSPCIDIWRTGSNESPIQVGDEAIFISYPQGIATAEAGTLTMLETDAETGAVSIAYEKVLP